MDILSQSSLTIILLLTIFNFGFGCKDEPVSDDIAGSTVNVDVLPESINELITDEISLTCTPQDLPQGTQNILFMELGKEGEHPLVSLIGPTLKPGTDMKSSMKAQGHIAKNLNESYLQLSIKRPFVDDVGVYCCRMFYHNEFGELKMGHVYADVTIENNDKDVFIHLLKKVTDLENTVLKQQNYSNHLENTLEKQQNYANHLEKNLEKQQNYTKELEKTIRDESAKVSSRFDHLEDAGMNRSAMIQDIVNKDTFSTAFSVYGTKSSFGTAETLVFKHFQLNVGDDYDLATGVFTSPRKGLYVFHLSVWTYDNHDVRVQLKLNDVPKAELYARELNWYDQSSISTVLSLNEGDKVWPYVSDGGKLNDINDKYTIFNGYLLRLV